MLVDSHVALASLAIAALAAIAAKEKHLFPSIGYPIAMLLAVDLIRATTAQWTRGKISELGLPLSAEQLQAVNDAIPAPLIHPAIEASIIVTALALILWCKYRVDRAESGQDTAPTKE